MIGHFLGTLTAEQEDRVLTTAMFPGSYEDHCLVGVALTVPLARHRGRIGRPRHWAAYRVFRVAASAPRGLHLPVMDPRRELSRAPHFVLGWAGDTAVSHEGTGSVAARIPQNGTHERLLQR